MSDKEIDETTMGHLMQGTTPVHDVRENPVEGVVLGGTVVINKSKDDLGKARKLRDMVDRAIAALEAIAPAALVILVISLATGGLNADSVRKTWPPRTDVERSWGSLSKAGLQTIHAAAAALPVSKIDIVCGGTFCQGLAEDLDEALASAGHEINLGIPMFDIGKGAAISPDSETTRAIASAIKAASGYQFKVLQPRTPDGKIVKAEKIVIAIGRKPR